MANPKLRFKRDDGSSFPEWETNKIGSYLEIRDQKEVPSLEAPLMAFVAYQGVSDKGERYDRSFLVKSADKKYKRTEYNDFIYSSNNLDVGSIGLNKYGSAVISVVYEIFRCKDNCDPDCMNALLQMPQNIRKMLKFRQGALYGQYKIPPENFLTIKMDIPCLEEQKRIADFLSSIDEVIAASEAEVQNLDAQRKAVMKMLFSQEIRFKRSDGSDFSEWEEIYFWDAVSLNSSLVDPAKEPYCNMLHVGTANIEKYTGNLLPCLTAKEEGIKSGKYLFDENCVVYSKIRPELSKATIPGFVGLCSADAYPLKPREGILPKIILMQLLSDKFVKFATSTSARTKMPKINQEELGEYRFSIPCFEEQRLIADFLSDFDEAIAAAKRELELWKELKKGLLQQMFV